MFKLKERPFNLLLPTAMLVLICSIVTSDETFDLNLHDTYLVVAHAHFLWITTMFLFVLWVLYFFTYRFLFSKTLTWIHVASLTGAVIFCLAFWVYSGNVGGLAGKPRMYLDERMMGEYFLYDQLTSAIGICLALILLGIVLYLINLILGLIRLSSPRKKLD